MLYILCKSGYFDIAATWLGFIAIPLAKTIKLKKVMV